MICISTRANWFHKNKWAGALNNIARGPLCVIGFNQGQFYLLTFITAVRMRPKHILLKHNNTSSLLQMFCTSMLIQVKSTNLVVSRWQHGIKIVFGRFSVSVYISAGNDTKNSDCMSRNVGVLLPVLLPLFVLQMCYKCVRMIQLWRNHLKPRKEDDDWEFGILEAGSSLGRSCFGNYLNFFKAELLSGNCSFGKSAILDLVPSLNLWYWWRGATYIICTLPSMTHEVLALLLGLF